MSIPEAQSGNQNMQVCNMHENGQMILHEDDWLSDLWQQSSAAELMLPACMDVSEDDPEPIKASDLALFSDIHYIASASLEERFQATLHALAVALDSYNIPISSSAVVVDTETSISLILNQIDQAATRQIDSILHHPQWKKVEASWKSLAYLIAAANNQSQVSIELLDCEKSEWIQHFSLNKSGQSKLYQLLYENSYDLPGAFPYTAVVTGYYFKSTQSDLDLLEKMSTIAMQSHCPLLANTDHEFFNKRDMIELSKINDTTAFLSQTNFIHWRSFREKACARYVGLCLPRFLLRNLYGNQQPIRSFNYHETAALDQSEQYLWAAASFALGGNIITSFIKHGWPVHIRGPRSGGKISGLPMIHYGCHELQLPTQMLIPESKEMQLAQAGFIPLSYYAGTEFACFFSANSVQKPKHYDSAKATSNSRINARLPYIFLSSRIAHYIKVLQREVIGMQCAAQQLEYSLNKWLQGLVTKMADPDAKLTARYPLRHAHACVAESSDNPGFFRVNLELVPHFQVEGMDVHLYLVSQLPSGKN